MRKAIVTERAPKPLGPYSRAVIEGDFIFVAVPDKDAAFVPITFGILF
jgi:enamine deaminase RidA (YjgF/YER057c/UK114 family)